MTDLLSTKSALPGAEPRQDSEADSVSGEAGENGEPGGNAEASTDAEAGEGAPEEAGTPGGDRLGPGEHRSDEDLRTELLALLFASPDPLAPARVRELLQRPRKERVEATLESLVAELEASPLPVVLRKIAGGWRLLTDPQMGDVVARLRKEARPDRITGAAMETLAIIAYRQPVTKAEVEAIRGVQSGAMLRSLVDRGLARVSGRADLPGSPLQYATTKDFLERFGLPSLKDLPRDGELIEE